MVAADLKAVAAECTGVGGKALTSDAVYGVTIEGTGPAARLWLTVSGQQCSNKPAADFAGENFCDRSILWSAGTQKFEYAPVATVRMIQ